MVVNGDTISEIAGKYHVNSNDIVTINMLRDAASIRIGMELMIPGAIKKSLPAVVKIEESPSKTAGTRIATKIKDTSDAKIVAPNATSISPKTGLKDRYTVKYTGMSRGFV
jgi:LysM repeat protein